METLIVLAIVAVAAVYVGRIFYKGVSAKNGCGGAAPLKGFMPNSNSMPTSLLAMPITGPETLNTPANC